MSIQDLQLIFDAQFWLNVIDHYRAFGPLAPIFLAMLESFIPALPLVLIITFNTSAYGFLLGFLYSYIGNVGGSFLVFLFFRMLERSRLIGHFIHGKRVTRLLRWVVLQPPSFLMLISALPFTPSSFINLAFGLSGYSKRRFFISIASGKFIMIALLTAFGKTLVKAFEQPLFIVLSIVILGFGYYLSHRFGKLSGLEEPQDH